MARKEEGDKLMDQSIATIDATPSPHPPIQPPSKLFAATCFILSFICAGCGHALAGYLLRAWLYLLATLAIVTAIQFSPLSLTFPGVIAGVTFILAWNAAQAAMAFRDSLRMAPYDRPSKWIRIVTIVALLFVSGTINELAITPFKKTESFRTTGPAMLPTILHRDRITTHRNYYRSHAPERGEIAVFKMEDGMTTRMFRVLAVAGDKVSVSGGVATNIENGVSQKPDSPIAPTIQQIEDKQLTVPENHVFLIGDNSNVSHDSRYFGCVPIDNLLHKALYIWWSVDTKNIGRDLTLDVH
jgi:signal peptidase I